MKLKMLLAAAIACGAAFADVEVPLWPEGKIPSRQERQCTPFLVWHTPKQLKSTAILISVSGGSYMGNGITGFEVAPIRDYFLARGVTVVTMKYRVPRLHRLQRGRTPHPHGRHLLAHARLRASRRD